MALPRRSNFDNANRDALFTVTSTTPETYFGTTGRAFVERLQIILRDAQYQARKAYRVDGPLGGGYLTGASNTDFGPVIVDGRWGPVTNAALWRYVAEHSGASIGLIGEEGDFDARTLGYLDAIERQASTRTINKKAVEAALWVWMSGTLPWADSDAVRLPDDVVLPVWDRAPPSPSNPLLARLGPGEWVKWLNGQSEPQYNETTGYTPTPTPGQTNPPAPAPGQRTPSTASSFPWLGFGIALTVAVAGGAVAARKYGYI